MKKNKLTEAKSKNEIELKKDVITAKQQLNKTRLEIQSGKTRNIRLTRILRKDIAQLETILRQKEIQGRKSI
ncbi:MAG: 50S ribosomal protein L29 [Candidatus Gottesmanbacteria bacterium]